MLVGARIASARSSTIREVFGCGRRDGRRRHDERAECTQTSEPTQPPAPHSSPHQTLPQGSPSLPSNAGACFVHTSPVIRAYVGLGSNLGDREATPRRALDLLAEEAGVAWPESRRPRRRAGRLRRPGPLLERRRRPGYRPGAAGAPRPLLGIGVRSAINETGPRLGNARLTSTFSCPAPPDRGARALGSASALTSGTSSRASRLTGSASSAGRRKVLDLFGGLK